MNPSEPLKRTAEAAAGLVAIATPVSAISAEADSAYVETVDQQETSRNFARQFNVPAVDQYGLNLVKTKDSTDNDDRVAFAGNAETAKELEETDDNYSVDDALNDLVANGFIDKDDTAAKNLLKPRLQKLEDRNPELVKAFVGWLKWLNGKSGLLYKTTPGKNGKPEIILDRRKDIVYFLYTDDLRHSMTMMKWLDDSIPESDADKMQRMVNHVINKYLKDRFSPTKSVALKVART